MARLSKATLKIIASEVYGVNLPADGLDAVAKLVNDELTALEKCEPGLGRIKPAMSFDPSFGSDE